MSQVREISKCHEKREDRTSVAPARSVPGLREASNQARRSHVQNEGREGRLCASGSRAGETLSTGH